MGTTIPLDKTKTDHGYVKIVGEVRAPEVAYVAEKPDAAFIQRCPKEVAITRVAELRWQKKLMAQVRS